MKKLVGIILALVLSVSVFAACDKSETKTFTMYVPDGAPLLAVATVADKGADFGKDKVEVTTVTGTQIGPALLAKTPDIALAPINVCATAYNKTDGEYVLCGVSVWGLNYIVSKDEGKEDLSDFVGETIYAFQETGTPGITLKALITMYELEYKVLTDEDKTVNSDKINIIFLATPADVRTALTAGMGGESATHGVLSEPLVTAIQANQSAEIKSTLDTQKIWEEKTGASYPQVGLVVRKSLISERKADVEKFVNYVSEQSEYIKANAEEIATTAIDKLGSTGLPAAKVCENFIKSARGQAAFTFGKMSDSKTAVENYLDKLVDVQGLSIVGGKTPDGGFYFA